MSQTNDTQAKYGEQPAPTGREPMLSDNQLTGVNEIPGRKEKPYTFLPSIWDIRDHYEHLITTGKLRVVEEVDGDPFDHVYQCSGMHVFGPSMDCVKFCPGCGNLLKRP